MAIVSTNLLCIHIYRPLFSVQNLRYSVVKPFLRLAISGSLSFAAEAWSFEVTTILAGLISTVALDGHIITLNIATFIYLSFPFAVGIAASIKVGQLIGEGKGSDARRSCIVAFAINFVLQMSLIAILWPCSRLLADTFTEDEEVADLVTYLIPLSCIFMLGDAFQANTGGVMRGLGRQKLVLLLNILGFWVLAIPFGAILTFATNIGKYRVLLLKFYLMFLLHKVAYALYHSDATYCRCCRTLVGFHYGIILSCNHRDTFLEISHQLAK